MFRRRKKPQEVAEDSSIGTVDGGEGRGVPLEGHDERPPTGYDNDRDFGWDDGDPADRRRDPLRK